MKTLVIGATGYIGSRIAQTFRSHGSDVYGLARSEKSRDALSAVGVTPVFGDLNAIEQLKSQLDGFEVIIFAALIPFEDEQQVLRSLVSSYRGAGRTLIFISGSGVVSTPALQGEWNDFAAAEHDPYPAGPVSRNRELRLVTENLVLEAAVEGARFLVIRPPLVWGYGGSIQIPQFFESARKTGTVCYLGQGLNLYSHVHVDDLANATYLAFERGKSGRLYHLVAGEVNFRTIAEAGGEVTGCPTRSLDYDGAVLLWGATWVDIGLAVNSRLRAPRTRAELGWRPVHVDLITDIRQGSYKKAYEEARKSGDLQSYTWNDH